MLHRAAMRSAVIAACVMVLVAPAVWAKMLNITLTNDFGVVLTDWRLQLVEHQEGWQIPMGRAGERVLWVTDSIYLREQEGCPHAISRTDPESQYQSFSKASFAISDASTLSFWQQDLGALCHARVWSEDALGIKRDKEFTGPMDCGPLEWPDGSWGWEFVGYDSLAAMDLADGDGMSDMLWRYTDHEDGDTLVGFRVVGKGRVLVHVPIVFIKYVEPE